ncbi:hypothetical protein BaRGS_00003625 [Batillaria attramentaria]|uniref:Uncharacterized protein n=1 Tax=Batillaria attramentaria TaxID=370345 RepID=A0ABD0LZN0_9CAEN
MTLLTNPTSLCGHCDGRAPFVYTYIWGITPRTCTVPEELAFAQSRQPVSASCAGSDDEQRETTLSPGETTLSPSAFGGRELRSVGYIFSR